jgi:hypothetical protein
MKNSFVCLEPTTGFQNTDDEMGAKRSFLRHTRGRSSGPLCNRGEVFLGQLHGAGALPSEKQIGLQGAAIEFVARSVDVSKGRAARRADEESRAGLKKPKSYRDDLAPQQAVRTITIEKALDFWHQHHSTRLKRADACYI